MAKDQISRDFYDKLPRYETIELINRFHVDRKITYTSNNSLIDSSIKESLKFGANVDELCYILVPMDDFKNIPMEEFHQIIKDLTIGIYCFSEIPQIKLEKNVDMSYECCISPAYRKTRVAEILTEVDYMVKALCAGTWFPKEKRMKFSDVWRKKLDVDENGEIQTKRDFVSEFYAGGMVDIYDEMMTSAEIKFLRDSFSNEEQMILDKYKEDFQLRLYFRVSEIVRYENIFMFESNWDIDSILLTNTEFVPTEEIHVISTLLQEYKKVLKNNICQKGNIKYYVYLIKFMSFVIDLLVILKKNSKIPNIYSLQSLIAGSVHDETEIPPLICNRDIFGFKKHEKFYLHGGIAFEIDCEKLDRESAIPEFVNLDSSVKTIEINGNSYYVVPVEVEPFKNQIIKTPTWLAEIVDNTQKMIWTNYKQSESQVHEYFKRHYGSKGARVRKNPHDGLRSACRRGSTSIVVTLMGDISTSFLNAKDKNGYSFIHYAILNDQPSVFLSIINAGGEMNNSCGFNIKRRFMAVHLAAKVGAVGVFQIIVSSKPELLKCGDNMDWLPIHYACAHNHPAIIRVINQRSPHQLREEKNSLSQFPIHMAAIYGALDSMKFLLNHGIQHTTRDSNGATIVSLAILSLHTTVLKFLIEENCEGLNVWGELGEIVVEPETRKKSLKCMKVLSDSIENAAESIYKSNFLAKLKHLLGKVDEDDLLISSIFKNISTNRDTCLEMSQPIFMEYLRSLLFSQIEEILLNTTHVLSNIFQHGDRFLIDRDQFISPLMSLLNSKSEAVLVNTLNTIGLVAERSDGVQMSLLSCGIVHQYLQFLQTGSNHLRIAVCDSICRVCAENPVVQLEFANGHFIRILKKLIKVNKIGLKTAVSRVIRSTAEKNVKIQKIYIENGFLEDICNLLQFLKFSVKEESTACLSVLRGNVVLQKKMVAEALGLSRITEMLLSVEKLKIFGCKNIIALTTECFYWQKKTCDSEALNVLTMLMNSNISFSVKKIIIRTLGVLCLGLAHRTLISVQDKISTNANVQCFLDCFFQSEDQDLKLIAAHTISCLYLNNRKSNRFLPGEQKRLIYKELLNLFRKATGTEKLQIGSTLVNFCFGSYEEKYKLFMCGKLRNSMFHHLMRSPTLQVQSEAAFQGVILSCLIFDEPRVVFISKCIAVLIGNLSSDCSNTVVLTVRRISSILNSDVGLGNAFIAVGLVEKSIRLLRSSKSDVVEAVATLIGFLTFNNVAFRMLLIAVRNIPNIYFELMKSINKDARINSAFVETFQDNLIVGLPTYRRPQSSVYNNKRIEWRRVRTAVESQQRRIRNGL